MHYYYPLGRLVTLMCSVVVTVLVGHTVVLVVVGFVMLVVVGRRMVIVVISGDLVLNVEVVMEGREGSISGAGHLRPVPGVSNRLGETANDGHALMGEGLGVGVLVAHHDEGLAINGKFLLELRVSALNVVHGGTKSVELVSVLLDLTLVVLNVGVVLIDGCIVLANMDLGVVDAILEGGDGCAEGLSADEHVSGLGDLELVAVLSEEGAVGVEVVNGLLEVGDGRVGRGGGLGTTVVMMLNIVVVVVVIQVVVRVGEALSGGRSGDEKGSGESFHCCDGVLLDRKSVV